MPNSEKKSLNTSLIDEVSIAIQRVQNLEMLILSWEDRLRNIEMKTFNPISASGDLSTVSSSSSVFGDDHPTPLHIPLTPFNYPVAECAIKSCDADALPDKRFCRRHVTRACHFPDCTKTRLGPDYCIRHGGGKRCEVHGCNKGASGTIGGGAKYCIAHGGGRRCKIDDCKSTAKRDGLCSSHGGRYECVVAGCSKTAHGPRRLCVMHGGGKKYV